MSDSTVDVNDGQDDRDAPDSETPEISPSVRRLLRQYDVDVRIIRGTGPNGRIRPGDVLAIVGNPALTQHSDPTRSAGENAASKDARLLKNDDSTRPTVAAAPAAAAIGTTVFSCNMSRALAHRSRSGAADVPMACYVATAAAKALAAMDPSAGIRDISAMRILVSGIGELATTPHAAAAQSPAAVHAALAASAPTGDRTAELTIRHHGLHGNLFDLSPPRDDGEIAVLSVGGLQRVISLDAADGTETPRAVTQCQLGLSYRADAITADAAARLVAECVRILETWPLPQPDPAVSPAPG